MNSAIIELKAQAALRMNENTPRIEKCLDQLKEEEVWKRPNDQSNSIGNLILHLCGNITQYMIASLGKLPDTRQRNTEFDTKGGIEKNVLMKKLTETVQEAITTMDAATEEEMMRIRHVQAFEMSGIAIVLHVVEHYSYHTGQIAFYTKLLKDSDLGFYSNIELE